MKSKGAWRVKNSNDAAQETDAAAKPKPEREMSPERKRVRTMERATRLLAARPRAVGELRQRLLEKEWTDAATVDEVLARLTEYGYLDDAKFAQNYAEYQIRQKPVGRQRLRRELAQHKVSEETTQTVLDEVFREVSEENLLDEALAQRLRVKGRPQTPAAANNLASYLLRRGFRASLVWEKVRAAGAGLEEDEDAA